VEPRFRLVQIVFFSVLVGTFISLPVAIRAQSPSPVANWAFDSGCGPTVREAVSGADDKVGGFFKCVPGVSGNGARFDGYTTSVTRSAAMAPKLRGPFTLDAWVALDTYPWNWVPIVDQELDFQTGYFFGIDAFGHVGLQVAGNNIWRSVTSTAQIPLKRWAHLAGTFDPNRGLVIYLDGKEVGSLASQGAMLPAEGQDLLIGRVREPQLLVPSFSTSPHHPAWYSLDGILDDIAIYNQALSAEQIKQAYTSANAPAGEVIPWPALPSGPPGKGPFGAFYATLKFEETWDRMRRIGPDSDVIVRFDESPIRLVFWQGTNYIPAWVTENGKWYTDEFLESYASGCPNHGDCEPMSDKQERYSHVNIVESSDARVVIHWRYAEAEPEHYLGANPDPLTGWFDWTDEYWTVYPDGVAVRKQVLRPTDQTQGYEWQESIVINQPGHLPEDSVNTDAITLANMKGESATYTWGTSPPGIYTEVAHPRSMDKPDTPNIQEVNLKSTWKPFEIVSPVNARVKPFNTSGGYFSFGCWNHWPVTQIASSGRFCVAPDRASHFSLTHIFWDPYASDESSITKLLLNGLTTRSAAELVPLAKSWLSPPSIELAGDAFRSEGYDPAQRAYVLVRAETSKTSELKFTLAASESSPMVNPAIVVKNWGDAQAELKVNGKSVAWSEDFRRGYDKMLDGTNLIVWIRRTSTTPIQVSLSAQ
jgi:hypothetical protein